MGSEEKGKRKLKNNTRYYCSMEGKSTILQENAAKCGIIMGPQQSRLPATFSADLKTINDEDGGERVCQMRLMCEQITLAIMPLPLEALMALGNWFGELADEMAPLDAESKKPGEIIVLP